MSESKPCLRQTMDRVSEIRARCEAATPGPWKIGRESPSGAQNVGTINGVLTAQTTSESNASFIAHARDDIPYLLARAEKAEAENRWIPVTERLPDKFGRYLTTHISTTYKGNKPQKKVSELDWVGDECGWLINGLHQVTHWRPLPEPPKGE